MAISLPGLSGNSPISADLMYQFYDNKAITPQIREALQKRQEAAKNDSDEPGGSTASSSAQKFGPAARVDITDQIIRMNIADKSTKPKKEEAKPAEETTATAAKKKPSRFDVLEYVKKNVAEREASARAEKDKQLQEISDKIAADEAAKNNPPAEEEPAT